MLGVSALVRTSGGTRSFRARARPFGFSETFPFELREQEVDGALDDDGLDRGSDSRGSKESRQRSSFSRSSVLAVNSIRNRSGEMARIRAGSSVAESGSRGAFRLRVWISHERLRAGSAWFSSVRWRSQQRERRQMDLAGSDERVNDGKLPSESRRGEATKCFAFTEVKRLHAEFEHRRKPRQDVQSSVFDFREIDDEPCGELALRADEPSNVRQKRLVRVSPEIHEGSSSTRNFVLACPRDTRERRLEPFANRLRCESSRKSELRAANEGGVSSADCATARTSESRQTKSTSRGRFSHGDTRLSPGSDSLALASEFLWETLAFSLRSDLVAPAKVSSLREGIAFSSAQRLSCAGESELPARRLDVFSAQRPSCAGESELPPRRLALPAAQRFTCARESSPGIEIAPGSSRGG